MNEDAVLDVSEASERLMNEVRHLSTLRVGNDLGDQLLFVRETFGWTAHYFRDETYQWSLLTGAKEAVDDLLPAFMTVGQSELLAVTRFRLDEWETVTQTGSSDFALHLSRELVGLGIPHTVASADFGGFSPIYGSRHVHRELSILAPREHVKKASSVMKEFVKGIQRLYDDAERKATEGDIDGELACYDALLEKVTDDPVVHFNKGVILFDRGEYRAAAAAFADAVQLDPRWNHLGEAADYLERIGGHLPDDSELMHTLASVAQLQNDDERAKRHLERIIELDPSDAVAHLNLGYLYYEDPESTEDAIRHFRKYLEIEPKAEDRPVIESIIEGMT